MVLVTFWFFLEQKDRTFLEDLLPWSKKLPKGIRKQLLSVYLSAKVNAIIIPSFYSILQLITLYIGFANTNLFVYKNLMVPDTFHAIQYDVFLINSFFSRSISFLSIINYMVVFKKDRVNFWSLVCPHGQSYFSFQESHPHSCRLTTAFFQNSLYLIFFASSLSDQLSKCQCWR